MASIYLIENIVNGKKYIGFTTFSPEHRFKEHIRLAINKNHNTPLHRAIRKYGPDNFKVFILEEHDDVDYCLTVLEPKYIKQYNSYGKKTGYNCTLGGEGTFGFKLSKERKAKLLKANLGRKQTDEHILVRTLQLRGKIRSDESKKRYSLANKRLVKQGKCVFQKYKNTIWMHNTKTNIDKRFTESELQNLSSDWIHGRLNYKKRIWCNNGELEQMLEIVPEGWNRGRIK